MKPEINALTLPINNLARLKKFYTDIFGWRLVSENENVAMFKLNTTVLTLCTQNIFSSYSKLVNYRRKNQGLPFTINLSSVKEVDERFNELEAAGAQIVNLPAETEDGYCGSVVDPENNSWVICYKNAA